MTTMLQRQKVAQKSSIAVFGAVMLWACVFPSLATWLYFVVLSGSPAMGSVYTLTKILQFGLPIPIALWAFRERLNFFAGKTRGTLTGIIFGLSVAAAILLLYLGYLRNSPVFATFDDSLREKLQGLGATTPLAYAVLALFISLFHSLLEEYYWRWFVFAQLRARITRWWAYGISSIGFAAHHVIVVGAYTGWSQWPWILFFSAEVAVGGAFWCWLYEKNNSLFAPWISHLLVDVALLAVGAIHLWG